MVTDYYVELGVGPDASSEEIRSAYRKQAVVRRSFSFSTFPFPCSVPLFGKDRPKYFPADYRWVPFLFSVQRWHPDKWRRVPPDVAEEAREKFQRIQEAYSGPLPFLRS